MLQAGAQVSLDVRHQTLMAKDDWFRNENWNERIETNFFEKLGRARSQRDQYLAIQALTLAPKQPKIALRLVSNYFDTRKNDFCDYQALIARATAFEALKDFDAAVATYKELISWQSRRPNVEAGGGLRLAYLVATEKLVEHFDFALEQLESGPDAALFPAAEFERHAAAALIYSELQEPALARAHADRALTAANIRRTGLQYHQEVGLVGSKHRKVVKAIRKLATDKALH